MNPYSEYKVYGPYIHKKEGRRYVHLVSPNGRTTTSYARYLMATRLGRLLGEKEQVDHIDNNKMNDSYENLQILTQKENLDKSRKPAVLVSLVCPNCGVSFVRERRQTHIVKGGKLETCCSRSCSGKYQHKNKR